MSYYAFPLVCPYGSLLVDVNPFSAYVDSEIYRFPVRRRASAEGTPHPDSPTTTIYPKGSFELFMKRARARLLPLYNDDQAQVDAAIEAALDLDAGDALEMCRGAATGSYANIRERLEAAFPSLVAIDP